MNVHSRVKAGASPAMGVVSALVVALAGSFLLGTALWAAPTRHDAITLALVPPVVTCLALCAAALGMRRLVDGSRAHLWARRVRSVCVTGLIVYACLVLPLAILSVAGGSFQGG